MDNQAPNWEIIFDSQVIASEQVDGGYANQIWHVQTERGNFVVKIPSNTCRSERPFWFGLYTLFGLDIYQEIGTRPALVRFIQLKSPLQIPRVIRVDSTGRRLKEPYVVCELLEGERLNWDNGEKNHQLAHDLGEHIGCMHRAAFKDWGSFSVRSSYPLEEWKTRLPEAMHRMAERWYAGDERVLRATEDVTAGIQDLPEPTRLVLILPDLRASQFLSEDGHVSALIDVESHVVGPYELDWINLEYSLPPEVKGDFVSGYRKFLEPPSLERTRRAYRLLYFLMKSLGDTDLTEWMNAPVLFE